MNKIALLLTCHNRKQKTLAALKAIYTSADTYRKSYPLKITTFITDDGSVDGTAQAVKELIPDIVIIKGSGSLFWAEGMRMAWKEAEKYEFDGYLLLNDDTYVYEHCLNILIETHSYSIEEYGIGGVYIGATDQAGKLTYSGSLITNNLLYTQKRLTPNGTPQRCDIGNANIMLVASNVVHKIGIMTEGYSHGMGDYDYTLKANRHNLPVLLASEFCGECAYDHEDYYKDFIKKKWRQRRSFVYNPLGLDFNSHIKFNKHFYPWRVPFVWLAAQIKIYFPKFYSLILKIRIK